jgi:hypothetical protein
MNWHCGVTETELRIKQNRSTSGHDRWGGTHDCVLSCVSARSQGGFIEPCYVCCREEDKDVAGGLTGTTAYLLPSSDDGGRGGKGTGSSFLRFFPGKDRDMSTQNATIGVPEDTRESRLRERTDTLVVETAEALIRGRNVRQKRSCGPDATSAGRNHPTRSGQLPPLGHRPPRPG